MPCHHPLAVWAWALRLIAQLLCWVLPGVAAMQCAGRCGCERPPQAEAAGCGGLLVPGAESGEQHWAHASHGSSAWQTDALGGHSCAPASHTSVRQCLLLVRHVRAAGSRQRGTPQMLGGCAPLMLCMSSKRRTDCCACVCLAWPARVLVQVSSLCPAAVAAPAQADAAAGSPGLAEQQQPQQQQTGSPAAGLPAGQQQRPQFEHLEVLDLSRSAGLNGRPVKFQLDEMQAAMPNLRVLKLSGLGGPLYGEQAVLRGAGLGHWFCSCSVWQHGLCVAPRDTGWQVWANH